MRPVVYIVDDDPAILFSISGYLSNLKFRTETAPNLREAKKLMAAGTADAVILDMQLPDGNGIEWIPELRKRFPSLAIIMITGAGDIPLAVKAMQKGADTFLTKPIDLNELEVFLDKSLELNSLRRSSLNEKRLQKTIAPFWGETGTMSHVKKLVNIAAGSDSPILLLGETGTGKGVLAHWIHDHSRQNNAAFVEINCTSLKGELLSSELFGHRKGAFTSAVDDKQGLIEVAHRGTLFLDEIGDLDMEIQTQLLKVIEEKQFRRLGDVEIRKSDFRLLCATNRDLVRDVEDKKFRQDLFYRINVFPIEIPPVRERREDIEPLILHLLKQHGREMKSLGPALKRLIGKYSWPGNIREMRNILERAVLLAGDQDLAPEHFPGLRSNGFKEPEGFSAAQLESVEANHIRKILGECSEDTEHAARVLGISRASLYRKIQKYQLKA
jgi:DNA-binding NtrC family response regulator